jgi:hypothetical protein
LASTISEIKTLTEIKAVKLSPKKQDKQVDVGPTLMKSVGDFCNEEIKTDALVNNHSGKLSTANKYL